MTYPAIAYRRISETATPPRRATPNAAGLDLHADLLDPSGAPRGIRGRAHSILECHSVQTADGSTMPGIQLLPHHRLLIPTGLAFHLAPDLYGRVAPRSGHALNHGIATLAGVVDRDYSGELFCLLHNTDPEIAVTIFHGMKICQLVIERISLEEPREVDHFPDTDRGAAGFGSTGV